MTPLRLLGLLLILATATVHGEIHLQDSLGRDVALPHPAQRIVSLAPHITETLFAVGAGDNIVGTATFSDYPEAAKEIPVVGSYDKVNRETLVALDPDLIIVWASGNAVGLVDQLSRLGFTVYASDPRSLDDIHIAMEHFATLAGTEAVGHEAARRFSHRLQQLQEQHQSTRPISVFYQVWNQPLLTLNGHHLISDVIQLCGGRNVFADAVPLVPTINVESVLLLDPQVIIASGMDEERPEWLDAWRQWPSLQAVRNQQLYSIPPSLLQRHAPRILEGATLMCENLDQARAHLQSPTSGH